MRFTLIFRRFQLHMTLMIAPGKYDAYGLYFLPLNLYYFVNNLDLPQFLFAVITNGVEQQGDAQEI